MSHAPAGTVCTCNQTGWMPDVEHVPPVWQHMIEGLTGVAPGRMQPIVGVDHIMQGWQTTMIRYCQEQNPERRVVATFTIGQRGRIVQHLSLFDPGRHVGIIRAATWSQLAKAPSTHRGADPWSVSWEHEGFSVDPGLGNHANIRAATWSPQNPWPEAMVEASTRTKIWAWLHVPSLRTLGPPSPNTLVGHYELDGTMRINDPADANHRAVWPRARFLAAIQGALGGTQQPPEGYMDKDYTVIRPGEWLSRVATRVGLTVQQLVQLNAIPDANQVKAWQVLRLHTGVPLPVAASEPPFDRAGALGLVDATDADLDAARADAARALERIEQAQTRSRALRQKLEV